MLAKAGLWLLSALKGAQPGASMLPACLWLANSREERTKGGPFRGFVVCFDLRRKMYCLYLKNLAEMVVLHPSASFHFASDTSYSLLLTQEGWWGCVGRVGAWE